MSESVNKTVSCTFVYKNEIEKEATAKVDITFVEKDGAKVISVLVKLEGFDDLEDGWSAAALEVFTFIVENATRQKWNPTEPALELVIEAGEEQEVWTKKSNTFTPLERIL